MKTIHLVCNAHLDPVWLWEWEEGAAEALSTFRTAADLCEEFDAFVFNHNEVVLYQWVEEYEPALFERIQRLVRAGRWHIMGGWYLQPDCNLPSGESFVRQILLGRRYFSRHFGVTPRTAINFDPFGHTRGLVQILAKSGYDSYLFCRPGQGDCPLPAGTFVWEGYDGSRVTATRAAHYNSPLGRAHEKIRHWAENTADGDCEVVLWGVGNHGGGPSREDLRKLTALIAETADADIRHSTPEAYFSEKRTRCGTMPVHAADLNPWAVGCYTSQVRIKQGHRRLENELYATEKMAVAAWQATGMPYPAEDLREASRDLAFAEFHDILPGSSIQPVEDTSLRLLDHGLELLSRIKARAFFALAAGQPAAKPNEIPILAYNPHPFPVRGIFECEFQLADQNRSGTYTDIHVRGPGGPLPTQVEDELSSIPIDWRKRVVFAAELAPGQMNRFDCELETASERPVPELVAKGGRIRFETNELTVEINTRTGLVDRYAANGVDCLKPGAFRPLVIDDDEDPWGMRVSEFRNVIGRFTLLPKAKGTAFSGVTGSALPSVRVIEDGAVRSVVEAVFGYGDSFICQRYKLPRKGTEIEVETRVLWHEKDKMLKLSIPTQEAAGTFLGEVAYGAEELPDNGREAVAQKWTAVRSADGGSLLTCINEGIYGSDFAAGEMRLTLLRSPGYSAHPIGTLKTLPQDRFSPRIDQGERLFRIRLNGGPAKPRRTAIAREALAANEKPMVLSFFPSGQGTAPAQFAALSGDAVQVTAVKKAEDGDDVVVRLFEPTGAPRTTTLDLPMLGVKERIKLGAYEIKTLRVDAQTGRCAEADLMENPLSTTK